MEILCVIEEKQKIFSYHTSYKTLNSVLTNIKYDTNYYMIVDHLGIKYSTNLLKILNRLKVIRTTTWSQLTSLLNINILLGYQKYSPKPNYVWKLIDNKFVTTEPPEETTKQIYRKEISVKTYSFDNSSEIEADFGSREMSSIRNLVNLKTVLRDIIFKKKTNCEINFSNTIPIINGVCFCPFYYSVKDELYAPESTKYIPGSDNKNIVLIDFSPVSTFSTIRLSECERKTPFRNDKLEIILPQNRSLENKSVILVLGGRLFFSHEFSINSSRSIIFDIKESFNDILISNRIYKKDYDNQFKVTTSQIEYYVNEEMWKEDNYNNFIIILDNKNVKLSYVDLRESTFSISTKSMNMLSNDNDHRCRDTFLLPSSMNPKGLLCRNINRDIIDYVYDHKYTKDILTMSPCFNIVITDTDLGYVEDTTIKTYGDKISSSSYILKNIFISD